MLTPGIYKAGLNPIEGEAVVEAALNFMRTDPYRSLGIVAMNKSQSDFINERLQYAIARDKKATEYVERWNAERGWSRGVLRQEPRKRAGRRTRRDFHIDGLRSTGTR